MSSTEGNLKKMYVSHDEMVNYTLRLGSNDLFLNPLIGNKLRLEFNGQINCIICSRKIKKVFGQGLCYPCFINAPENAECILRPELCQAHLDKGRDPEWERINHLQAHIVYLALSGGLKVGVTRKDQIPTRWIDQGASETIIFAETPYRYLAGKIEVQLKAHVSDKTNWQRMLKNIEPDKTDLVFERTRLIKELSSDTKQYISSNMDIAKFNYPILNYPEKVKSIGFDKQTIVEGVLTGIRGQYLYFDNEFVINIRKHSGYLISVSHD